MPRDKVLIERFNTGIVTAVSKEDLPPDAASISTDVDNASEQGILRGRRGDSTFSSTLGLNATSHAWITEDDGARDLVYYNGSAGSLNVLQNFYGGDEKTLSLTRGMPVIDVIPTMAPVNKAVHIGLGNATIRKWIGVPQGKQFGGQPNTEVVIEDDVLRAPSETPVFHKIVANTDYIFGIEFGDNKIYKINRTTEEVTDSGDAFTDIRAMCMDTGGAHLWIYSMASTNGRLSKVALANFAIAFNSDFAAKTMGDRDLSEVVDIGITTAKIWLANGSQAVAGQNVWVTTIPTTTGTGRTSILLTPFIRSGVTISDGDWVLTSDPTSKDFPYQNLQSPLSLIKLDATHMGWLFVPYSGNTYRYLDTDELPVQILSCIYILSDATATAQYQPHGLWKMSNSATQYPGGWIVPLGPSDLYYYGQSNRALHRMTFTDTMPDLPGAIEVFAGQVDVINTSDTIICTYDGTNFLGVNPAAGYLEKIDTSGVVTTEFQAVLLTFDFAVAASGVFDQGKKYFWKAAYGYDGFQTSPLSALLSSRDCPGLTTEFGEDITITVADITKISPRLSSISIYRASGDDGSSEPDGFYRLVQDISLEDKNWVLTESSGTTEAVFILEDHDSVVGGASYEAQTGLSEVLETYVLYAALEVSQGGYLFIANCKKSELPDADHMVFRSKAARPSMFDWASDVVRLPVVPTALVGWNGRLFAFSETDTYRINPEAMVIEDVTEGIGVLDQRGVCATEYGLLVANKTNIYLFTQQGVAVIGEAIRAGSNGWSGMSHQNLNPIATYSPELQSFIVFARASAYIWYAWMYYLPTKRWDRWKFITSVELGDIPAGLIIGKEGECYLSGAASLQRMADTNANRKLFDWTSARLTFDGTMQEKKVYKALFPTNNQALTLTWDRNNSGSFVSTGLGLFASTGLIGGNVEDGYRLAKCVQLKLASGHKDLEVYSGDIIFRKLIGER